MCFVHFFAIPKGGCSCKLLSKASKQISNHSSLLVYVMGREQERRAEPFQKVPNLTNTLSTSLHVGKHPTCTRSSRFVTCCHTSIAWILPQVHHVLLLFGSAIPIHSCLFCLTLISLAYLHIPYCRLCNG